MPIISNVHAQHSVNRLCKYLFFTLKFLPNAASKFQKFPGGMPQTPLSTCMLCIHGECASSHTHPCQCIGGGRGDAGAPPTILLGVLSTPNSKLYCAIVIT